MLEAFEVFREKFWEDIVEHNQVEAWEFILSAIFNPQKLPKECLDNAVIKDLSRWKYV